ncbi:alpha-d-galacturonidase [Aridibaculum aurantiacum]|uniref:alpha-d-galacturonidase n=1 Tax=Aridibaculum aurantiacum TaxID=2810307 RepID=UPI001A979C88|nr:hypothetical protein [Aridibaculum aurantiacum]
MKFFKTVSALLFVTTLSIPALHAQEKATATAKTVAIVIPVDAHARVQFGAEKLAKGLVAAGYKTRTVKANDVTAVSKPAIVIATKDDALLNKATAIYKVSTQPLSTKEGFAINASNDAIIISGNDASGALYGSLELAEQIAAQKKLPSTVNIVDAPEMVMRGACVGLQKPVYLPGRHVYEYPYTPETFPWFYDKALWIKYLDMMVDNRMNSLYLWNGHPFASLVKLKDYPYAVEVDDETFKKNEEMFTFLTTEADKRGIWVVQMFYNIIVSKPFAEKHGIKTQDRNRPIVPLIADYTRKSIAAFVEKYPNVGLLVALGEAMEGVGQDDIDWFTQTIIPGVKDGLKALGDTTEPPIVLRAHDTDAPAVMKEALPLYKNLYTMAKYNGEALTTYTPRGPWAELHRKLSNIGTVQIENVHILANLEPFRYGSPDFIQKSVQAMHNVYQANGLHLYPEASYWDWPYTADKAEKRLLQIDRDWIWNKAWSRYAWKANRDRSKEINYWSNIIGKEYGTNAQNGKHILTAYEETGEIAPKLLRRFGITDGNRQTLTLGMLMTQLINPYRYGLFTLLYNSEGPEGEMLTEYAEKEWKKQPHIGETPVQVINEVRAHGDKAVKAIELAAPNVKANKAEFARIKNDMHIYNALANNFASKAEAALHVLRYKYSNDISDLEKAVPHLQNSVDYYKQLVDLTKDTYLYANSMQTQQRKIPVGGNDGKMKEWWELLPIYEQELTTFKRKIDSLKAPQAAQVANKRPVLKSADVKLDGTYENYLVSTGSSLFVDTATYIKDYAEELKALNAIKLDRNKQLAEGTTLRFSNTKPVKVLVGYFNDKDRRFLQAPQLETDASANDYGQAEAKINNALLVSGMPPVNIHTYSFKPGNNTLTLAKGTVLILGFVDDNEPFPTYDTGLVSGGVKRELDWLFE